MKKRANAIGWVLGLSLLSASAQFGGRPGGGMGGPQGPQFSGSIAKLFGDNSAFSAGLEVQMQGNNMNMTLPGKMAYDQGKSRFEMDMSEMKGGQIPPETVDHMKSMGMDKMTTITIPDKKSVFLIYPGMQAYAQMALPNPDASKSSADFKVETTELGKETVDGHSCVKNKVVVTDNQGKPHEYTVWNATDLKKFPVKLESNEGGHPMTMLFKDVKLSKPDASLFEPPSDFKKYDSMQSLMQEEMMKRMGGMGMPPKQ